MTTFSLNSREIDFYDPHTRKRIATYKFIKSKTKYYVKYVDDYPHDNVYVEDIAKFKQDKGYMVYEELGQMNLFDV